MEQIIPILLFIGSSVWVLMDAKAIRSGESKDDPALSPGGWFVGCLLFWILAFPLYLAKRSKFKKIYKTERGASVGATIAIIIVCTIIGFVFFSGERINIQETATELVTQIMQEQLSYDVSCVGVKIEDKPVKDFYRATAFLDNGDEVAITIQDDGSNIVVNVLNN